MFTKVIIGVDGYSGGSDALRFAATLAADGAELVLADASAAGGARTVAAPPDHETAFGGAGLARPDLALRLAPPSDLPAEAALHGLAAREGADLIVTGLSAAHAGLSTTPCPLVVAPRGHRAAAVAPRVIGVGFDASP